MNKNIILILTFSACLVMGGCWNKKDKTIYPPKYLPDQTFHPAMIRPLTTNSTMEFKTLTPSTNSDILSGGKYAYQCLSWNDYLILGQNMQLILSKFDEYEAMLCYYRRSLKEERCKKFNITPDVIPVDEDPDDG